MQIQKHRMPRRNLGNRKTFARLYGVSRGQECPRPEQPVHGRPPTPKHQVRIGTLNRGIGTPVSDPAINRFKPESCRVGDRRSGSWEASNPKTGRAWGP